MIETRIDTASNLTVNLVSGSITLRDLTSWLHKYYSLEIARRVKEISVKRTGGKSALVFAKPLGFGLGRMFETFASLEGNRFKFISFMNMDDAIKWHDI